MEVVNESGQEAIFNMDLMIQAGSRLDPGEVRYVSPDKVYIYLLGRQTTYTLKHAW